ncbi:MAG: DUF3800 domain-containing protein, partial [Phycisphaerae bacterium]
MEIDVYCDESRPDLLSSNKPLFRYMCIGSLWLSSENRLRFKQKIHQLRDSRKYGGEFKWQKVSDTKMDFYKDLVDWFWAQGSELRFRCIAVDHEKVDLSQYHGN